MNKTALKNFATSARRELLQRIELQARKVGVTSESIQKAQLESSDAIFIDGKQLSEKERVQRYKLISHIQEIGFDRVMEEVAYTWFNRFTALRFMEVNDYLPTKVRVLSSINPESTVPDMMKEALSMNLDLDKDYVYGLKINNDDEGLFKYLTIKHCNDLNRYMPFMFEKIDDYTEILFPEGLLATDSCIRRMTNIEVIPESNWKEIEVIGWLYQFYISEEKEDVFANLKKNIKITKNTLPAATQLFTPNWIVRYLVENSLGRIWIEGYPESHLKEEWKYYLDKATQENSKKQLDNIKYSSLNPEEIKFLDPSCGSGHILVYAFDVFYNMYLEKGYMENEIPRLILQNNIFGLEVDKRAAQLASFAITMKAREKSRRIFRDPIQLNICAIEESNWLTQEMVNNISENDLQVKEMIQLIKNKFLDAKEYGSLLDAPAINEDVLLEKLEKYSEREVNLLEMLEKEEVLEKLPRLLKQTLIMNKKYDIVCTNPPYMGRNGMNPKLIEFLDKNYPDSKSDLFAAFIEQGFKLSKSLGFNSMVTMQSWMFLSSYQKMREKIIRNKTITTLLHMDNMVMGIAFGTAATVIRNTKMNNFKGEFTQVKYFDLSEKMIPKEFPIKNNRYGLIASEQFIKIPGSSIAYWLNENILDKFNLPSIGKRMVTREGMATADNNRFLRYWFEVIHPSITFGCSHSKVALENGGKWFPYNKGGSYRKWYGNNEYVVNWENDGYEIRNNKDEKTGRTRSHNYNGEYAFRLGITWSALSSGSISVRYSESGFLFDSKGAKGFSDDEKDLKYIMGLINSKVGLIYLEFMSPTIDYKVGDVIQIPLITNNQAEVNLIIDENILISKEDWDSYETSWDFLAHPLLSYSTSTIENAFHQWERTVRSRFERLKSNEEILNSLYLEAYGMEKDFSPSVDNKDINLREINIENDIKSFISYAIGCIFGRYSLKEKGVAYAGGEFNSSLYEKIFVDEDNIVPFLSSAYFKDDIVTKFIEFVQNVFDKDVLEENLNYISKAIGMKNNETAREALRRYFLNDFYKDHVQVYKKRPIYWLFTSGKEKAFNCLIYMHRYNKTTLSRIRTDYLHKVQIRMDAEKKDLLNIIEGNSSAKEISNAKKELKSLDKKIDELKIYDEKLHHMADMQIEIDLDDGVAVNYAKFEGLVAKI